MAIRRISLSASQLVAGAAIPVAGVLGLLIGTRLGLGMAFAFAIAFSVIALLDLPLSIALWVGLSFSRNLTVVWIGPTLASVVLLVAWLGAPRAVWDVRRAILSRHRMAVVAMLAYLLWITMSVLWAHTPSAVIATVWQWWVAGVVTVVVATVLRNPRDIRLAIGGFVVGAAASVFVGLVLTGLHPVPSAVESAAADGPARLTGGLADPNYLAAGLVPAIVLGVAMLGSARGLLTRMLLLVSVGLCAVGLIATESRGGLLAAAVAALVSLGVFRRQRARVALCLLLVVSCGAVYLATSPAAYERISTFDGGGSGRADLWRVAWRIGETEPIAGIGLNNFVSRSQDFVREPGVLREVHVIVERPVLVHNLYLQTYVETGIVGLALLLVVVIGLLVVPLRAARRFEARGDPALATLARAVFVAQMSALVALVFLSAGADTRWWVLFGLGPALVGVAGQRRETASARGLTRDLV